MNNFKEKLKSFGITALKLKNNSCFIPNDKFVIELLNKNRPLVIISTTKKGVFCLLHPINIHLLKVINDFSNSSEIGKIKQNKPNVIINNIFEIVNWFKADNQNKKKDNPFVSSLSKMKVVQLLYCAQNICMKLYNTPLFSDTITAGKYGPMISRVYNDFDNYSTNNAKDVQNNYQKLNNIPKVRKVLLNVSNQYSAKSTIELLRKASISLSNYLNTNKSVPIRKTKEFY